MYKLVISLILAVVLLNSCEKSTVENEDTVKKISCVLLTQETLFSNTPSKVINQYDNFFNLLKSETIVSDKVTSTTIVQHVLNSKNKPTTSVYKNDKDVIQKTITIEYTDNINIKKRTVNYAPGSQKISELYEYNPAGKQIHYAAKFSSPIFDIDIASSYNKSNLLVREETVGNNQLPKLIENTYDEKDKLLKSTTTIGNAKSFIEYSYNDKAQIIRTTTDLGVITDFTYTEQMIESVSKLNNKVVKKEKKELDKNGNVIKFSTAADGVNFVVLEERQYSADNKLQKRISNILKPGSNTETVKANEVTYDNNGNPAKYLSYSILTGELILTESYTYSCKEN